MCPLCDQEQETVQHLLSTCVFAQHFWFKILTPLGFQDRAPRNGEISFADWWRWAFKKLPKEVKKGVNMMIILGAWTMWNHRNACVFEGARPCSLVAMPVFEEEHHLCCMP